MPLFVAAKLVLYKTDDQFWFSFFHEAGHILLHGKRNVFLEFKENQKDEEEKEANKFAADLLIPQDEWKRFLALSQKRTKAGIRQFASEIGIAPGIVVGRLQHEKELQPSHCNDLKRRLEWGSDE